MPKHTRRSTGAVKRVAEEELRLKNQVLEAQALAQEIESDTGSQLMNIMYDTMKGRIEVLMKEDPQCQSLMKVLQAVGCKLDVGENILKRIFKDARVDK